MEVITIIVLLNMVTLDDIVVLIPVIPDEVTAVFNVKVFTVLELKFKTWQIQLYDSIVKSFWFGNNNLFPKEGNE